MKQQKSLASRGVKIVVLCHRKDSVIQERARMGELQEKCAAY